MNTHRVTEDGVFMPRTINRPDQARYRYVRPGEAVKEWRHPGGEWLPFPPNDDIEVVETARNDLDDAAWIVPWIIAGLLVTLALLAWWAL